MMNVQSSDGRHRNGIVSLYDDRLDASYKFHIHGNAITGIAIVKETGTEIYFRANLSPSVEEQVRRSLYAIMDWDVSEKSFKSAVLDADEFKRLYEKIIIDYAKALIDRRILGC